MKVEPFNALMPGPDQSRQVAAPPYDVVTLDTAQTMAAGNPLSFLRVSRAEIELSPDTDPYSDAVYQRARANFDRLRADAPLSTDPDSSYYLYSMLTDGRRQTGIAAAASVDDYDAGRIKINENTRPATEADRTRHLLELRAHTGPVLLACRADDLVTELFAELSESPPLFDVECAGTRHQVWRIPGDGSRRVHAWFDTMPALYVADGHHRSKSASLARAACRDDNPDHRGDEAYNRFLTVIFPARQMQILAYNRVVHGLNGLDPKAFIDELAAHFSLEPVAHGEPARPGEVHIYTDSAWYRLVLPELPTHTPVTERLDMSVLQNRVLAPILGIDDQRTNDRIRFVGGIHGTECLQKQVDNANGPAAAFSMFPVTVDQLMKVSDAGMLMPPKSTWFEPKLLDGLLVHMF